MEPFRNETELIAELRALRAVPRQAFAAELDERAAAGFPRRSGLGGSPLADLAARLQALSPRRLLLSTGATALAALALATVIVAVEDSGHGGPDASGRHPASGVAKPGNRSGYFGEPLYSSTSKFEGGAPEVEEAQSAGSAGAGAQSSARAVPDAAAEAAAPTPGAPGPVPNSRHRDVERSAEIVLGADPADVADDSAEVFDAVHAADGIVLRSSTTEGRAGQAGASFDLLIPSAKLGDALAAFSGIDAVRSRHEATADITAPTVTVAELLQDVRARTDSLLAQLAGAETESEREVLEAEIDAERRHAASLRSRLASLHRRTSFSRVSLRIETGGPQASASGSWGVGDALHDAGHILTIAAAVLLVSLAVLGPIALVALLAWLAQRAWMRRGRERALG